MSRQPKYSATKPTPPWRAALFKLKTHYTNAEIAALVGVHASRVADWSLKLHYATPLEEIQPTLIRLAAEARGTKPKPMADMLCILMDRPGASASELAAAMGRKAESISMLVQRAVALGWMRRTKQGRAWRYTITDAGKYAGAGADPKLRADFATSHELAAHLGAVYGGEWAPSYGTQIGASCSPLRAMQSGPSKWEAKTSAIDGIGATGKTPCAALEKLAQALRQAAGVLA